MFLTISSITSLVLIMFSVVNIEESAAYNSTPDTMTLGMIPANLPTNVPPIKAYAWPSWNDIISFLFRYYVMFYNQLFILPLRIPDYN